MHVGQRSRQHRADGCQIVVGVFAKSQGLIADGIHTLSDLVADFVVLFASHHSKKDADEDHPTATSASRLPHRSCSARC